MPWVDLCSADDYASIFYRTNTQYSNVSGFALDKPTIVVLHPLYLDTTWLDLQFGDARLSRAYNMIAFDVRSAGRSVCRPNGRHDSWVDAADLAFCFYSLQLPPAHFLALEGPACDAAIRFAVLFPDLCLSLTLINAAPPAESQYAYNSLIDLTERTCFAADMESFDDAVHATIDFWLGKDCDPALREDMFEHWGRAHPPSERARTIETVSVLLHRGKLSVDVYSRVTQPVLVVHGERNNVHDFRGADRLVSALTNVQDGAVLYTVKGGTAFLSVMSSAASLVHKVFSSFLARLPKHRSDLRSLKPNQRVRMQQALKRLAEITGDPSLVTRDTQSPMSFSCLPSDMVEFKGTLFAKYRKDAEKAFVPVPLNERNTRASSEIARPEPIPIPAPVKGKGGSSSKRSKQTSDSTEGSTLRADSSTTTLDSPKAFGSSAFDGDTTRPGKSSGNRFGRLLP